MQPNHAARPKGFYSIIFLLFLIGLFITAYWTDFFTSGTVNITASRDYINFQETFPLADSWAAFAAFLSIVGLLKRKSWGVLFGLISGSSVIMIGLMDVLYNINQGNYKLVPANSAMNIELFVNLFCLLSGTIIIIFLWRNRTLLTSQ